MTSGNAPTANSVRNPAGSSSRIASSAASTPPIGNPHSISPLIRWRRPAGAISTTSAMAVGGMPPKPRPARNRNSPSDHGSGAVATSTIISENHVSDAMNRRRRPIRSVSVPEAIAPRNMPNRA